MPKSQSKSDIRKKHGHREKRGFLKTLILWSFLLGLVLILCGGAGQPCRLLFDQQGSTQNILTVGLSPLGYYDGLRR